MYRDVFDTFCYLPYAREMTTLLNRPPTQKSICEIDPYVALSNSCFYVIFGWICIKTFRKLHWDWLRFCMRICSLKAQHLILKIDFVNRPRVVYSRAYGISFFLSQNSKIISWFYGLSCRFENLKKISTTTGGRLTRYNVSSSKNFILKYRNWMWPWLFRFS